MKAEIRPHDEMTSGKNKASLVIKSGQEVDEKTRAEQVDEAIDPN